MRRAVQSLTFHSLIASAFMMGPSVCATGLSGIWPPSAGGAGSINGSSVMEQRVFSWFVLSIQVLIRSEFEKVSMSKKEKKLLVSGD
jgi:hypothetical protein